MSGASREPGALHIAARTFLGAPRFVRYFALGAVVYVLAMTVWMGVVLRQAALGSPQLWAGLAGAGSAIVLSTAYGLFEAAQGTWSMRWQLRLRPQRMHRMLLAMPVLAYTAGILAAISVALIAPLAGETPLYLLGLAGPALVALFAGQAVSQSTRFLYGHAREQAEAAARARAEAGEARLAALQAQLNPHFLFNTLNTIAALARTDAVAAEATTENLARLLRHTLSRTSRPLDTLAAELEMVRAYLDIERQRFGERLRVEWCAAAGLDDARLPPLTLQPLVENAIKHGVGARLGGGTLRIEVRAADGVLTLAVEDDGPGFGARPAGGAGTGLANLRQRLATLYGDRAGLRVEPRQAGARVVVHLPLSGEG